ncbi:MULTISPECIES: hypothetical protein [Streptomyces]
MSERRVINNRMSGEAGRDVIQAETAFVSSPTTTVNKFAKEARSLSVASAAYRAVASLAALSAVMGVKHGGTPLRGAAFICDALAIPSGWTRHTATWIDGRPDLIGLPAATLLMVALLALPKRRHIGSDVAQTLEWRAPSTAVLAFVVLVQCGYVWLALQVTGILAVVGVLFLRQDRYRTEPLHHVLVAVGAVVLAVVFVPLFVVVWVVARDGVSASHTR